MPTLKQLKVQAKSYGLKVSGKKTDLEKRIDDAIKTEYDKRVERKPTKSEIQLREEAIASLKANAYSSRREKHEKLSQKVEKEKKTSTRDRYLNQLERLAVPKGNSQMRAQKVIIKAWSDWKNQQPPAEPIVNNIPADDLEFIKVDTFNKYLHAWKAIAPVNYKFNRDLLMFLDNVRERIREKLSTDLQELSGIKFQIAIKCEMSKKVIEEENLVLPRKLIEIIYFRSEMQAVLQENELIEAINKSYEDILSQFEKTGELGSGFSLERVLEAYVDVAKYEPLTGGSYIKLPKKVALKKACVNVKNNDDECLRWALRSALFPAGKNSDRTSSYPTEDGLKFEGINFPTPISQISKVEKQNNIAINVYGWNGKMITVLRISPVEDSHVRRINLLLINNGKMQHYTWIKNLNRLLCDQNKHKRQTYWCERCLHPYSGKDLLEKHLPLCKGINKVATATVLPKEGEIHKFENYHKQLKAPFIIYADFESIVKPISRCEPNPEKSSTEKTDLQEVCGYGYVVVRSDNVHEKPVIYRGEDAAEHFLKSLEKEESKIIEKLEYPEPMILTTEDKEHIKNTNICHICKKKIFRRVKVRDHCHITGKFRGVAHESCNLKLRIYPKKIKIPVVFHNLKGYDSHLIMQKISETLKGEISCIANTAEKYVSFSVRQLKFIDSVQFLKSSLDELVSSCKPELLKITSEETEEANRPLIIRKGVYPYEYMDSFKRFKEKALPPKEAFYSSLCEEHISDDQYDHAQKVWEAFQCQNLGDYHDLYLKTDVMLLADVFENFRAICMKQYELDPANYYTSPGLAWDALLKKSEVKLELISDVDMHLFLESGIRGGISMVSKRYARANNPHVSGYDSTKPKTWIQYLDANNLYGYAMSQSLPVSDFEWGDTTCFDTHEQIMNIIDDSPQGCILEVDLEYPQHLHETHNAYPLAPEKLAVPLEWMSPYQKNLAEKYRPIKKLVPNLHGKEKYIIHYRNLKLYLCLGMKLTKVHRVLTFNQSPWMKDYILMNTEFRKAAKCKFEEDFYKLMNNSVYGKSMENVRNRTDIRLVRKSEEKRLRKLIVKPTYAGRTTFNGCCLTAIRMHKEQVVLNKPIQVGFSVLEMSKHLMYDWYYNFMKKKYGSKANLCYTDTDSLLMEVETEDIYRDMLENFDEFDTSNYPKDHFLYNVRNKKVIGKMKDECGGRVIAEYVGLRPKMYSVDIVDEKTIKKAKGVKKYVVEKHFTHEMYKETLDECKIFHHEMNMLGSYGHNMYNIKVNKKTLSPLDTKRWIDDDGITTNAYGFVKG